MNFLLFFTGIARVKLRQNGTVSYFDQTGCFLAGGRAYIKLRLSRLPT